MSTLKFKDKDGNWISVPSVKGAIPKLKVGTVEFIEGNEEPDITITGSETEPLLNFKLPKSGGAGGTAETSQEVINARGSFANLKARLDDNDTKTQTAKTTAESAKSVADATKSEVETARSTYETLNARLNAIASSINSGGASGGSAASNYNVFDNLESLRAGNLNAGDYAFTLGYYTVNDMGGADYVIRDKKETDVDDGGSKIFLTNGKVAELILKTEINVCQFGAKGDPWKDSTFAFKNAIAFQKTLLEVPYNNRPLMIVIPAGTYRIKDTLEIGYYTRMKTKGMVRLYFVSDVEGAIAIHIKAVEYLDSYFEHWGFQQSPLLDGSEGSLLILRNGEGANQIGIKYGIDAYIADTGQPLKNSIRCVEVENFTIGFLYTAYNNYLTHFYDMGIRNNKIGIQLGDENHKAAIDSGENPNWHNCTIGGNGHGVLCYAPIHMKFHDCSFDMNQNVCYAVNGGSLVFSNCHIEDNGLTTYNNWLNDHPEMRGLFINATDATSQLRIKVRDCAWAYGGEDQGSSLTGYLIRGKIILEADGYGHYCSMGVDFDGGTLIRTFFCAPEVILVRKHWLGNLRMLQESYKSTILNNSFFENVEEGAVTTNDGDKIGDFTVIGERTDGVSNAQVLNSNELFANKKTLQYDCSSGKGNLELSTDYIEVTDGNLFRPMCLWNVFRKSDDKKLVGSSYCNMWVEYYDQNKKFIKREQIQTYTRNGPDFSLFPMWYEQRVPYGTRYMKVLFTTEANLGYPVYIKIYSLLFFIYNGGN